MVKVALRIENQKAIDRAKEAKAKRIRKIKETKIDLRGKVVSQVAKAKTNSTKDTIN